MQVVGTMVEVENMDVNSLDDIVGLGGNEQEQSVLIKADTFGVTTVTSLLRSIKLCEKVNVFVSSVGIRFVVEEGKYAQAALMFRSQLFKTFECNAENIGFKIPFKELLDCLKILGADKPNGTTNDSTNAGFHAGPGSHARSMQITYTGHGSPFSLSLEENGMLTEIELKTEEADTLIDFDEVEKKWDLTMDSKLLCDYLFELEGYSPEYVMLRVVPNKSLDFRASGTEGSLQISIPKSCRGIERFCTVRDEQRAGYKFSVLRYSFKLIQAADKVILQMGEMDVLSFRFVFKEERSTFAEFHIMPLAETNLFEEIL